MYQRAFSAVLVLMSALAPVAGAAGVPEKYQRLLSDSPFAIAGKNSATAPAVANLLEFHAVLEENGYCLFSLFETVPHHSSWIEMNAPKNGITVKEYNATTLTLQVDYQGKSLTLPLKGGRPVSAKLTTVPPLPAAVPEANETEYHDRPFRIGHVAEEVEIRRAVRQPAGSPTDAPAPPAGTIEN